MLGLKRGTVLLAPHETGWETYAAETMKRLRAILGDAAVEMQHVGSTAVPTIQAKPIVDLAVAVRQLSDVEPLFPALEAQGFYHAAHCDNEGQRIPEPATSTWYGREAWNGAIISIFGII